MKLAFGLVLLACLPSLIASDFQVHALYDMKVKLNATASQLIEWNDNQVSPCPWNYVDCSGDKVIRITLRSVGFTGVLSPSIAQLTSLQELSLQGNNITGGIPQEYGNLSSLTTLNLGSNLLSGPIPDSLGRLSKLQNLDLSENRLSGNIPNSFSNFPSLSNINLAFNNLIGDIPKQLLQVVQYNYTGNQLNCDGNFLTPCDKSTSNAGGSNNSKLGVVLGSTGGVVLLIMGVLFLLCWKRMRHRPEIFVDVPGEDDRRLSLGQIKRFSWRELQIATDNFNEDNILGQGGFGKVYKGVLPGSDSRKVAVKRLTAFESGTGEVAFLSEVGLISIAVHRNILRLIGFCTTTKERLLVYPFMDNLSVASRLRDIKPNEPVLDWATRRRIALGAARGLEYLHEHCNPKIIHRDVKAANVLLNENFEAVVGDFGLAKLMDVRKTSVTTKVRGTMGHIAPEYLSTGRSSEKTDIFGYGVMLLEIVTGQRAIDTCRMEVEGDDDVLLIDHVKGRLQEGRLEAIVDGNLNGIYGVEDLEKMIQIALLCTHTAPDCRPAMSEIVRMLEGEVVPAERWEEWQQAEVARRQKYEMAQRQMFGWGEESLNIPDAIELSGGR